MIAKNTPSYNMILMKHHTMTCFRTIFFLLVLVALFSLQHCQAQQLSTENFLKEFSKQTKGIESSFESLSFEGTLNSQFEIDKLIGTETKRYTRSSSSVQNYHYKREGDKKLAHVYYEQPQFFDRLIFTNGSEQYVIKKSDSKSDYYLEYKEWGSTYLGVVSKIEQDSINSMTSVMKLNLPKIICSPGCQIRELKYDNNDETFDKTISFTFDYEQKAATSLPAKIAANPETVQKITGSMVVLPDLMYCIQSFDIRIEHIPQAKASFHITRRNSYKTHTGSPLLERSETTNIFEEPGTTNKVTGHNVFEISRLNYGPVDPKVFEIDHYGLGEAKRIVERRPNYTPYYFLIGAVVFIGLGIYVKRS